MNIEGVYSKEYKTWTKGLWSILSLERRAGKRKYPNTCFSCCFAIMVPLSHQSAGAIAALKDSLRKAGRILALNTPHTPANGFITWPPSFTSSFSPLSFQSATKLSLGVSVFINLYKNTSADELSQMTFYRQ